MFDLRWAYAKHLVGMALAFTLLSAASGPAGAQTAAAGTGGAANSSIAAGTSQTLPSATAATDDTVPPDPTLAPKAKKKKAAAASAGTADPSTTSNTAAVDAGRPVGASGCRTRGFTVNDYGKDGPTADAKRLLDQDIADWTKANSLQNVKVGPKKVECFQFLNFVVFDEWTCTASAQICWK